MLLTAVTVILNFFGAPYGDLLRFQGFPNQTKIQHQYIKNKIIIFGFQFEVSPSNLCDHIVPQIVSKRTVHLNMELFIALISVLNTFWYEIIHLGEIIFRGQNFLNK